MEKEKVLTVREAAEILKCHPATVREKIESGELKAGKLGSSYRISIGDLETFYRETGGGRLFEDE